MCDSSWSISVTFISDSLVCALMAPSRRHEPWPCLTTMWHVLQTAIDILLILFPVCEFLYTFQTIAEMSHTPFLAVFYKQTWLSSHLYLFNICGLLSFEGWLEGFKIRLYRDIHLQKLPEDKDQRLLCVFQALNSVLGIQKVLSVRSVHLLNKELDLITLSHSKSHGRAKP